MIEKRLDHRILSEDVGDKVLETILQVFMNAYPRAYEVCHDAYPYAQATELVPFTRRAKIHSKLRQDLESYMNIQVTSEKHEFNNIHRLMIKTPRMLLSIYKVGTPEEMVPASTYPVRYSEDRQLDLFRPNDEPDETLPEPLFGVILHGFVPAHPQRLAFLRIAFPNKSFKSYVGAQIDLMQRFPEHTVTSGSEPIDQEIIAKPSFPRLKNAKRKDPA